MNAYKLNSIASNLLKRAILKQFGYPVESVYNIVKEIDYNSHAIIMKNGEIYELTLKKTK